MSVDRDGTEKYAYRIDDGGTACFCFPLRTAVAIGGLATTLVAIAMLVDRSGAEASLRPFVGGYKAQSRAFVNVVEVLGIFWGPVGIVGAVGLKTSLVKLYLGFQIVRLVVWAAIYCIDLSAFSRCNQWTRNVDEMTRTYGWNEIMFNVALHDRCDEERLIFVVCSVVALLVYLSFTRATQQLLAGMEEEPRYLLRVTGGSVNGAFYTQSLASKSIQTKMRQQDDTRRGEVATSSRQASQMAQAQDGIADASVVPTVEEQQEEGRQGQAGEQSFAMAQAAGPPPSAVFSCAAAAAPLAAPAVVCAPPLVLVGALPQVPPGWVPPPPESLVLQSPALAVPPATAGAAQSFGARAPASGVFRPARLA